MELVGVYSEVIDYLNLFLNLILKFKAKGEGGSLFWNWIKGNFASKLLYYLLRYEKPESNAVGIEILLVLQKSKQLKQFVLIFILDTYSCVNHRDFKKLFWIFDCYSNLDLNFSFLCKLERVRLEAKENLLDPIFVRPDDWTL